MDLDSLNNNLQRWFKSYLEEMQNTVWKYFNAFPILKNSVTLIVTGVSCWSQIILLNLQEK